MWGFDVHLSVFDPLREFNEFAARGRPCHMPETSFEMIEIAVPSIMRNGFGRKDMKTEALVER